MTLPTSEGQFSCRRFRIVSIVGIAPDAFRDVDDPDAVDAAVSDDARIALSGFADNVESVTVEEWFG